MSSIPTAPNADKSKSTAEEQEAKQLQTFNEVAKAIYGAPATPKAGDISGAEKVVNLASTLQPRAYDALAKDIAKLGKDRPEGKVILITSRANLGSIIVSARQIKDEIDRLVSEGQRLSSPNAPQAQATFATALTLSAVLAVAGAVESMVGLFRTDYAISNSDLDANKLGLQLAMQRAFGGKARIDGLDLLPSDAQGFIAALNELAKERAAVADKSPAAGTPGANFVAAADAIMASLRKVGDTGVSPAGQIASLLSLEKDVGAVLYVDIVKPTATAITTKRLFFRNDKVHLFLSGLVNVVYQTIDGSVTESTTLRIGESATLDLRQLEKKSYRSLDIRTG